MNVIVKQRRTFTGEGADVTLVGNVYHVTKDGWMKLKAERRRKRPATVPRPDPPAKRLAPDGDPAFFIAVYPHGNAWIIGRIPSVNDDTEDDDVLDNIACPRGWIVVCKRMGGDAANPVFVPVRFRGDSSTRVMKNGVIQHCAEIASELHIEPSIAAAKLAAAEVSQKPNVLED